MVQSVTSNLQLVISARDEASKQLKGLSKNIKGLEPTFKKMAKFGTVAFAAIGFGVFKATQLAVDAQETFNKFEVVFQDVSDQAEAAAQDLRDNFGLAGSSARKLLSDTGDMLVGLGVAGDAALDLSLKTQKLAVDLASFTNIEGGATRASEALTKGLLGERESMKALGIVINETDVKLRLLENGTANLTGTALKAARAQATLELAMEQSKSAIGDFARTSDQVANQQRVLQERFKELSESVGALFIPILAALVSKLLPVVESITDWAIANPTLAKTVIQLTLAISGLIAVLGVLGLIVPNISSGFKSMTGVIVLLRTGIIKLATVIGTTLVLAGRSALLSIGNFNVLLGTLASRVVPAVIAGMSRLGFVIGTTLRGAVLFAVNALRVSL
ncbi:MAG: hypothetical protein KAS32_21175, partial [Candidatus Peribacteraceae bacterium]|nr:hypothetical protein [Candidatus Peribacteraceae bacterium]